MICNKPIQRGPDKGLPATGKVPGYWRHRRAGEDPCPECAEAQRSYKNQWQSENPRPPRYHEYVVGWYRRNPGKRAEYDRRWRQRNPAAARRRQRNVRRASVPAIPYTTSQLEQRLSMFAGCWMCGGPKDEVDHVKPLSAGGADMLSNLRPACRSCNATKGAQWPYEVAA